MKILRLSAIAIAALAAALCLPATATASDKSDVMAVVSNAVASFNRGDEKTWTALCTSPAAIISNIAPFQYMGAATCADWWASHAAYDKKNGVTGEVVTLGTPWHVDVMGDRAYAVYPATFAFNQKGKAVKSSGDVLTIALQKTANGWLMTGWTWAQR